MPIRPNDDLMYCTMVMGSMAINATAITYMQQMIAIVAGLITIAYTIYKWMKGRK